MAWSVSGNKLSSNASGSPTIEGSTALYSDFEEKITINLPSANNIGGLVWGLQNSTNYYLLWLKAGVSTVSLYKVISGTRTLLDEIYHFKIPTNLDFKVTLHSEQGWISVSINGQTLLMAYDTLYPSGKIGFYAEGQAVFSALTLPLLYREVESYSLNSGDSLTNAISDTLTMDSALARIDYLNNFNVSVPQSSDSSVYTYSVGVISNQAPISDLETTNFITVTGANGVAGSAADQTSIDAHNKRIINPQVIQDLSLTTYDQCTRAAQRAIAFNKEGRTQASFQTTVNVGLELYDVISYTDATTAIVYTMRVIGITTTFDVSAGQLNYTQSLTLASP